MLLLDAPPAVLHARRPEHDLAQTTARRDGYLALAGVLPVMQVVDADRPLSDVVDDITERIVSFVQSGATSPIADAPAGVSA